MQAKHYFHGELAVAFANAVARGDRHRMQALLANGANIHAVGREGMSFLFWAMAKGSPKGFRFLLEHGADPNGKPAATEGEADGLTILELAAIADNSEYLRHALEYGGNPNTRDAVEAGPIHGRTILFSAIMHGRRENLQILIEAGADIDHQDGSGGTPVMVAASVSRFDMVYVLLQNGADPTLKTNWGSDLASRIKTFGDRGIRRGGEQHKWYIEVVGELQKRGLL